MATDLKSRTAGVSLTRFFGGEDRGVCVQVTTKKREPKGTEFFDSVQLTREQAADLAHDLMAFADGLETEDFGDSLVDKNSV
jgi:hypothetical protein